MRDPRIGVFVCECGGNISDVVDVKRAVGEARTWKDVVMARDRTYLCSKPSIEQVKEWIKKVKLDRVLLACCTPKMHRKKFERSFKEAGLNPALLEIVNAREQCSWVHSDDPEGATVKTIDLIRGGVERAKESTPLESMEVEVERSVMVVGGGIAGITAALRLAENARKVYLVESKSSIGGHMIQYPKVFPTLDCSQCILTPKMGDVADSPNIELLTLAEVSSVSGVPGNFKVTVSLRPRGVDAEKCTSCGACSRDCPVSVPNEFNEYLDERKAVYIPFPQAVPSAYAIDFENCTKCGNCVEACARKAIDLDEKQKERELKVGAIILATGFELYDISQLGEYRYGKHPNIITSMQMERLLDITGPTKSSVVRLSDRKEAKKVCYVLCAGSRDMSKGFPYCSRVCCLYAIKQATLLHKAGIDVWIHYIDIRTPGRRYEEFYKMARDEGINFVKGKIAEVIPASD
ncbi:MAG: 4Fe-4S binding protein, partial [bacterium]